MVALRRTKSGLWTARKVIPSGVREAYGKREEKTSWPADLPQGQAKAELAAWLTPIEERIERLKGLATQTPVTLSQRQCRALAGEWYKAQVALHEEEPGQAIDWDIVQGELVPDDPAAREAERLEPTPWLTEERDNLLRERMLHLKPSSAESLLQEMAGVFWNLCDLMQRRAGGDYGADPLIASLPELQETPEAVVSITDLFEGFASTGAMAEHKRSTLATNRPCPTCSRQCPAVLRSPSSSALGFALDRSTTRGCSTLRSIGRSRWCSG